MTAKRILLTALVVALATNVALASKKEDERIEALEERIASLEAQLENVEQQIDVRFDECVDAAVTEIAQRDQRANEALRSVMALSAQGNQLAAKEEMTAFLAKYSGTDAAKRAVRLNQELAVVGKPAPSELVVEKWYSGDGESVDLDGEGVSLVVFWEEWCPHCKREVPKLQATYDKFQDAGLSIVALTKITKSSTDEKVAAFIEANSLAFPIAKERGDVSRYFNVSGIPAAAVVQDGQIIWRGHPGQLNDTMIQGWLAATTAEAAPEG
jgi:thiol-disulfide isomerase/thioredoxin